MIGNKSGETLVETVAALLMFVVAIGIIITISMTALRMTGSTLRGEAAFIDSMNKAAAAEKSGLTPKNGIIRIDLTVNETNLNDEMTAKYYTDGGFVSFK